MKPKYRKGIFCVIYALNHVSSIRYLILKRKLHWKGWEFVKGGLKKSEKILDAVKREIKEETGVSGIEIGKFNVSGKYKYDKEFKEREGVIGQTYTLYSARINKGKIKLDKLEHSKYKWVSFKRAMKKLTFANQKKCLEIVHKYLENEI